MQQSPISTVRPARVRRAIAAGTILAVAIPLTLGIGGAFASNVTPGKYSGPVSFQGFVSTSELVTFKATKTKVKKLRLTPFVPNKCGGGGPPPKQTSKTVKIKNGKFTDTVKQFTDSGQLNAKAKVTGKFKAGGKVTGSFKSKYPSSPQCNAKFTYTATVGGHPAR